MRIFRKRAFPLAIVLAFLMLHMSVPYQPVMAAMISTESCLNVSQYAQDRDQVLEFLAREDVRQAFIAQGVAPAEVEARLASLTQAEIQQIAQEIENLPAGGDLGLVIAILVIVLLVLLIIRVA